MKNKPRNTAWKLVQHDTVEERVEWQELQERHLQKTLANPKHDAQEDEELNPET